MPVKIPQWNTELTSQYWGNKQLILFVFLGHMEWYIACSHLLYTVEIVLMKERTKSTIQCQAILTTEDPPFLPEGYGYDVTYVTPKAAIQKNRGNLGFFFYKKPKQCTRLELLDILFVRCCMIFWRLKIV